MGFGIGQYPTQSTRVAPTNMTICLCMRCEQQNKIQQTRTEKVTTGLPTENDNCRNASMNGIDSMSPDKEKEKQSMKLQLAKDS